MNEQQRFAFGDFDLPVTPMPDYSGSGDEEKFIIGFMAEYTVIQAADNAATIQAALEALTTVGAGNVLVTGSDGLFEVEFIGDLAAAGQPLLEVLASYLKQPAPSIGNTVTEPGSTDPYVPRVTVITLDDGPDAGSVYFVVEGSGAEAPYAWNASGSDIAGSLLGSPVSGDGPGGGPWTFTDSSGLNYNISVSDFGENPLRKTLPVLVERIQAGG